MRNSHDHVPDVRAGLTRRERIVLWCLSELQKERKNRHVPTAMLYGSVVEYVDMSVEEMQSILARFVGRDRHASGTSERENRDGRQ